MKKLFAVWMTFIFCIGSFCVGFADTTTNMDFEITPEGEVTAYYGGEWVVVPEEINGIPVVKIGEAAFFDLGIADVYLPDGLAVIGKSAFEGSNITSVDIPATASIIGERAFANCAELCTVFTEINEKTVFGKEAFYGTGHLQFYLNCDINIVELEQKIYAAKGNRDYEIIVRHAACAYDDWGNVVCGSCGYAEQATMEPLPFADVAYDAWYYDYVQSAYVNKIINGKSESVFDPDGQMTCAEAAKIAACIYANFYGEIPAYTEGAWYQPYVEYCYKYGIIEDYVVFDWDEPITRGKMAYLFSRCDPFAGRYSDKNAVPITDIPDVSEDTAFAHEILKLYNRGVAVGDESMAFYPETQIKRCEAAAIVARILDWNMRIELPKG